MSPPVVWAQRSDFLYVTVDLPDATNVQEEIQNSPGRLKLSCDSRGAKSELDLELYAEIVKEESEWKKTGRNIQFKLKKKESGFWPRLVATKEKLKFINIDWDKWVDEDEEDEAEALDFAGGEGLNYDQMQAMQAMQGMGGMGGMGGMPGMGGMGGMMGMPGMQGMMPGEDSDDEGEEEGKRPNLSDLDAELEEGGEQKE